MSNYCGVKQSLNPFIQSNSHVAFLVSTQSFRKWSTSLGSPCWSSTGTCASQPVTSSWTRNCTQLQRTRSLSGKALVRSPQCGDGRLSTRWIARGSRILTLRLMPTSWNRRRKNAQRCAATRPIQSRDRFDVNFCIKNGRFSSQICFVFYFEHFL